MKRLKKFRGKTLLSKPSICLYIPKRNNNKIKPFAEEPNFMALCNTMI